MDLYVLLPRALFQNPGASLSLHLCLKKKKVQGQPTGPLVVPVHSISWRCVLLTSTSREEYKTRQGEGEGKERGQKKKKKGENRETFFFFYRSYQQRISV